MRENGIDTVFPPLDGTGFYKMICKINHSCDPNVIVKYTINVTTEISTSVLDSDEYNPYSKPLIAQITALRSITAGEELVQSYIDSTLSKLIPVLKNNMSLYRLNFILYRRL